jgi:hypothetical protein
MRRAYSTNRKNRNSYRLLVGKRPLGGPRRMRVDNIKINFGETEWSGLV